jgi:hypothetical protein
LDSFQVDPEALEAFAKTSDDRQKAFDDLLTAMTIARVEEDAFGRIPGIGARIYAAYDEHVQACEEGVASAAEAMALISSGVRGTALNYLLTEEEHRAALDDLKGRLDGGIVV